MHKLQKVILVYDDHIKSADGKEAERYDEMVNSAAQILHGRSYNPFAGQQVKWKESPVVMALPDWLEKDRFRYAFESAGLVLSDEQMQSFVEGLKSHKWVYKEDYPGY